MNTAQQIISAGFDIANLTTPDAAPATLKVDLLFNADGDAVAGVVIVGKNSDQYRTEKDALSVESVKRGARTATAIDTKTDEGATKLVEVTNEHQQRLALAVVVDWYGFTSGGAPAALDKTVLAAAFKKYPTWVDAIQAGLAKDAAFLKV
jgi:hypothetical protein